RLEWIKILSLQVLDERELELLAIGQLSDDRRDAFEPGRLRGAQPALAGDELVAVDGLGHEDRLQDTVLADALRERRELLGTEPLARLMWVGTDPRDRDLERRRLIDGPLRDQRRQSAAEALGALGSAGHEATRISSGASALSVKRPSRRRNSAAQAAYASAPVDSGEYREIGIPWLGASDSRTFRGITESKTRFPRWRRASPATSADSFVRPSNMVSTTPFSTSVGLRWSRMRSSVASSWVN